MREDMYKVIVERPRSGRSWASKSKLRYVKGDAPARMTGKRIVTLNDDRSKYLNENLAPLKRYLRKQRGRKWDDAFSDICAFLDTGSTVKMHVREHIVDFIARNVRIDERGEYWATGRWGDPKPPRDWPELYVDPQDGLVKETGDLCRKLGVPTQRQYWKARRLSYRTNGDVFASLRKISDVTYLINKDGIWYQFELETPPMSSFGYPCSETELYALLCQSPWDAEMRFRVISKKQLSSKALKAHGLVNHRGSCG